MRKIRLKTQNISQIMYQTYYIINNPILAQYFHLQSAKKTSAFDTLSVRLCIKTLIQNGLEYMPVAFLSFHSNSELEIGKVQIH